MKVILKKDVPKVGQRLDIKDVPDGYADNFLLPRGLAVYATDANLAERNKEISIKEGARMEEMRIVEGHFKSIGDETLVIKVPVNEQGHLFKSVTQKTIHGELNKKGIDLPLESIQLDNPIKSAGPHEIVLIYKDKKKKLHLLIENEKIR